MADGRPSAAPGSAEGEAADAELAAAAAAAAASAAAGDAGKAKVRKHRKAAGETIKVGCKSRFQVTVYQGQHLVRSEASRGSALLRRVLC